MSLFVDKIVSSIFQIVIFAIIPFVWWLITARKQRKFIEWIGLKKMEGGKKTLTSIIIVSVAFLFLGVFILHIISGIESATSEFKGLGMKAVPAIIIYAAFNTALPEELLFRGFLLKRMSNKFGFNTANVIQALLFGLLHGAMFFVLVGLVKAILVVAFTTVIAWFMGYINEKISGGSIIPSWIVHAISNLFSGLCAAFLLI